MKHGKPLPPSKQLANLYDSLADDAVDGQIQVTKKTSERAARIVERAVEQSRTQDLAPKDPSQEWKKRTDKKESKNNAGSQER